MKKLRIAAIVIFVVTIISALAITTNAKWWDDNPFTDVKSTHWYYDAVRIANENGLVNGMSETKFSPSVKMTRAMLVQVLYNAEGIEIEFTGTPFTDVKAKHWYAKAVQWAYENEITSGLSETKFGAMSEIKREELAAMLYRYAEYKGMAIENSVSIEEFPDASKVSSWAVKNFEWAYGNSIISGSKKSDGVYLNPRNSATRAECAQMLSKYLYLTPTYEINGNDLSKYTIVYSAAENNIFDYLADEAQYLATMIEGSLGIKLPVVTDETPVSDYEILVGKTNREENGLVTVDRDSFEDDQIYTWSVQGNYLVIAGIDDSADLNTVGNRSHRNVEGTGNAVFKFCEEVLGAYEYIDEGELTVYEPDPVISLDDGYSHEDMTWYRRRTFYMKGNVNASGEYISMDSQNISMWLTGRYNDDELLHPATPCMTDEENVQTIINNVLEYVEARPELSMIGIGINDSEDFCRCDNCIAVYNQYGARSASLVLLVNRVSDALAEKYPDVMIQTGAYEYCQKPPTGITLRDNIVLEFFTVKNCSGHAYDDKNCRLNKNLEEYYRGWDEISSAGCTVWDHSGGFVNFMTPQPDWDSLLENVRFFADGGAREILMNSVFYGEKLPNGKSPSKHADLGNIRGYMLSMIYMDPYMSEEEYYYRLDKCLEGNYGAGWKNIREYIDIISELGNDMHHTFHTPVSGHYDVDKVTAKADYIDGLWEAAKAQATGAALERLTLHETSWIYMKQCATHESRYVNGTEEQRAEYVATNEYLYNCILDMRLLWTEGTLNPLDQYDATKNPTFW